MLESAPNKSLSSPRRKQVGEIPAVRAGDTVIYREALCGKVVEWPAILIVLEPGDRAGLTVFTGSGPRTLLHVARGVASGCWSTRD